jgi:glycosyltransferase involved in cell wall biosynthesis
MRPLSRIDQIVRAAASVFQRRSNIYFLFAVPSYGGDSQYESEVRALAAKLGIAARMRFVSAIPHQEMPEYYRLADVTISIPVIDGTPMSVLESMACGTPVVVGKIEDYDTEYIEHEKTVVAVDGDSSEGIADGLLRILEERMFSQSLVTEALSRVKATGSVESQMQKMERLYRSLR